MFKTITRAQSPSTDSVVRELDTTEIDAVAGGAVLTGETDAKVGISKKDAKLFTFVETSEGTFVGWGDSL